jgi:hypothetical protein
MNISIDYIISVVGLLISMVTILLVLMMYVRRKSDMKRKERYDFEMQMAGLEYMRKNMEMQLYHISKKLEENEMRWKDMNHLVISTQNKSEEANNSEIQVAPNTFLKNFGLNSPKDFEVDNKQVFVLTPFNDNYRETFFMIKNVCAQMNLNCIRGDEEFIPNDIFTTIVKQITKSRLIIANITGRNPNVMYELGVAHSLNKPTIVVAQDFTEIPFDLNNKRIVIYKDEDDLRRKLTISITDMLLNKVL